MGHMDQITLNVDEYFDQIGPDIIKIKGHRLGVEHILKYYLEGYRPEDIAAEYPGLSLEIIYATITLYLANKEELDTYIKRRRARDLEAYQQWASKPPAIVKRLRVIREEKAKYL